MTGLSRGAATALADKFPWADHHTVIEVGAAEGCVPVQLALRHPHLTGGGFDLPAAGPAFGDYVASHRLSDRLRFYPGDFFADPLPPADVLVMWATSCTTGACRRSSPCSARPTRRYRPAGRAWSTTPSSTTTAGANTFGLLMSVNMLIETHAGFDYTSADCRSWLAEVGFRDSYAEPLARPDSMVVGIK